MVRCLALGAMAMAMAMEELPMVRCLGIVSIARHLGIAPPPSRSIAINMKDGGATVQSVLMP
jgi:hypothetical protein